MGAESGRDQNQKRKFGGHRTRSSESVPHPDPLLLNSFLCLVTLLCLLIHTKIPGFAIDSTRMFCSKLLGPNKRRHLDLL